ncbi:MAG: peptidoglycan DD-metalloendopeptidase family protein [Gemmatimonadetes bacterium]|nr:peptidoglycan DD-metalloendopeptidase family protein [Gemmatimonadota bacterium]NNM34648.1 peptidoglycan DD-metalloendopeptidase family protein [Gemmatimonadota bacterium]
MAEPGGVSIIIVPEGSEESRTYALSPGRIRFLTGLGITLVVVVLGLAASWSFMARRALAADDLARQVDSLTARQGQMEALAQRLADLEGRYNHIRSLFGSVDRPESDLWLPRAGGSTGLAGGAGQNSAEPTEWPLTVPGFVTQPLVEETEDSEGEHPGIDIAVPTDSYVRAAGSGQVVDAASDPTYGLFVLIDHGSGYRTLYGHASTLLVDRGQEVQRGEVIALSGSTGRSTAPHLHFEILRYGEPVDPLSMVTPP